MDSFVVPTPTSTQSPPQSATASDPTSSPALSSFSRGCSARSGSSASSLASSPITRESTEIFRSTKTPLEGVREESQPEEAFDLTHSSSAYFLGGLEEPQMRNSLAQFHLQEVYNTSHSENTPGNLSAKSSVKRQRLGDSPQLSVNKRFSSRFPSFGKKWKSKTGASPKLSIITHTEPVRSRESSAASSRLVSPALSAISKHENHLPPSPVRNALDENIDEVSSPGPIEFLTAYSGYEGDQGQATTPLLPPMLMELASSRDTPVQSPLQSPTVAEPLSSRPEFSAEAQTQSLPSPPLSTKPSVASFRGRSRNNTIVPSGEIPPMAMLDEQDDKWSQRLGHADFNIHPEPYIPETKDIDSYRQLRANWNQARTSYAKHLARTGEHYGTTSKIYLLTEEKWATVDAEWKRYNTLMTTALGLIIERINGDDADLVETATADVVLGKPITKVMVPRLDETSGKFPEMGDEDIVGPMSIAPPRANSMQNAVDPSLQVRVSKRGTLLRFLSLVMGRHRRRSFG